MSFVTIQWSNYFQDLVSIDTNVFQMMIASWEWVRKHYIVYIQRTLLNEKIVKNISFLLEIGDKYSIFQ